MSNLNNNTTQLEALLAKVNALPEAGSGGTDTSDATAIASEIFAGETAYIAEGKVTGTFTIEEELNTQDNLIAQISTLVQQKANPPSTDTSDATATASDILSGKTAYIKGKKVTGNIPSKAAAIYTPTTSNQTISSGTYLNGVQTIKGDANLVAGNIKSGTSIFGVTGTYEGSGGSGSDSVETCTVTFANLQGNTYICCSILEDGTIRHKHFVYGTDYSTFPFIIENVLCNSFITFTIGGSFWQTTGVEELHRGATSVFRAPSTANANGSIANYLD